MYDIHKAEDKLEKFLDGKLDKFVLDDALDSLGKSFEQKEDSDKKGLRKNVKRFLDENGSLFFDTAEDSYLPRSGFFSDARFCVTPTTYELEHGILIPGHRFAAFCSQEIFPSDVTLKAEGSKKNTGSVEHRMPLRDAAYYHNLLGIEDMMDCFIAEHPSNIEAVSDSSGLENVILSVFDMKEFFENSSFEKGDALIFKVKNWDKGRFSFSTIKSEKRSDNARIEWIRKFDKAVEKIIDEYDCYIEIPDQLACAFWRDENKLLSNPEASLDEFIMFSEKIQISVIGSQSVLSRRENIGGDFEMPEGLMVSRGETDSLEEILRDIGSPLKKVEIEAYMLDELYEGSGDIESFHARCFDGARLNFADDAQEAFFLNFIDDLWENISETYNPDEDAVKGEIRANILEVTDEKLSWLRELKDRDLDEELIPQQKLKVLAESSVRLNSFLGLLNSRDYTITEEQIEDILDSIEKVSEVQSALISDINREITGTDI